MRIHEEHGTRLGGVTGDVTDRHDDTVHTCDKACAQRIFAAYHSKAQTILGMRCIESAQLVAKLPNSRRTGVVELEGGEGAVLIPDDGAHGVIGQHELA